MDHSGNGFRSYDGHGEALSRLQELAIVALLRRRTVDKAAADVGVSPPTLYAWMKLPQFKEAYAEARRTVLEDAIGQLKAASRRAVDVLAKNLRGPKPADQIRAADILLSHALRVRELDDIEKRLRALERRHRQERRADR